MGKKSKPKAPTAPDPKAVAQAQGEQDLKTAISNANLNRINQYGPTGSLTYTIDGYNADGTPRYSQHETYSPEQQKLYEQQMQVSNALSGVANQGLDRVRNTMGQDFNFNGMQPQQFNVDGGPIQSNLGDYGQVQTGFDPGGKIQTSLDYSGLNPLQGAGDFSGDAKRVADALYGQATSRLDPQWEQQRRQLATQLAGKGITENSEAYRRAMDQAQRQQTDAYNQANFSAIGAGGAEQSRLFGLSLAQRQQGKSEIDTQGNFANAAQQQQYDQNLGQGEFANSAQNQRYNQALGAGSFANTAQQQRFGQGMQNADLNNQGRQQQIQEATYLRNLPLDDISKLLGAAGGTSDPNFENVSGVSMPGVDYAGLVQNQYNAQMQQYQAKMQARNQGLGSLFGLGGSALGGLASNAALFSDKRLKEHIHHIGTTIKGIPTYTFNYIGSKIRQYGVMAQDVIKVIPEAVGFKDGYMTVDYGKVW